MDASEATRTLTELEALRRHTRARIDGLSFPLMLFGGVSLVAAGLSAGLGDEAQGAFWSFAGPGGAVVVSLHYRRRELDLGLSRAAWPYVSTAAALLVACATLGALGEPWEVGPWLAVAVGYLVFGWLERSWAGMALAAALGALAVVIGAGEVAMASVLLNAVYGGAFLVTGWLVRDGRRAP